MAEQRLLIVGSGETSHVGRHLLNAARNLKLDVRLHDLTTAYHGTRLSRFYNWHLRSHRPAAFNKFNKQLLVLCAQYDPQVLLTTGLAPVSAETLEALKQAGLLLMNFLTDDPWNPAHYARWFFKALPKYDIVFSPRRRNLEDLENHGCKKVCYLPFAYAPEIHFPQNPENGSFASDIVFIGGADSDRIQYATELIRKGIKLSLYGGYWDTNSETRKFWRGHSDAETTRKAIAGAKLSLVLVRQANRDGHAMRSFETAAMRGCMVVEDTEEHHEIFDQAPHCVAYFGAVADLTEKVQLLLEDQEQRRKMALQVYQLITSGQNTYKDRLVKMLEVGSELLRR
jgi:spore maturation protein CgeB